MIERMGKVTIKFNFTNTLQSSHQLTLVPGLGRLGNVTGLLKVNDVHVIYTSPLRLAALNISALIAEPSHDARPLSYFPGEVILHADEEEAHPRVPPAVEQGQGKVVSVSLSEREFGGADDVEGHTQDALWKEKFQSKLLGLEEKLPP